MAYCVKCGVRLDEKLETCPLCGTPAIDTETLRPKAALEEAVPRSFSGISTRDISDLLTQPLMHRLSQRTAAISTLSLLVPIITTLLIDILSNNGITWSFYPILSVLYFWIALIFPYLLKSGIRLGFIANFSAASVVFLLLLDGFVSPVTWAWYPIMGFAILLVVISAPVFVGRRFVFPVILVYTAGAALSLWAFEFLLGGRWFLTLGLPLVLLTGAIALLVNGLHTVIARRRSPGAGYAASGISAVLLTVYLIGIDIICTIYIPARTEIGWSLISGGLILLFAAFLFVVSGNQRLRNYVEKKFHV